MPLLISPMDLVQISFYDAVGGTRAGGARLGNKALGPDCCLWLLGNGTAQTRILLGSSFVRGVRVCAAVKIFDFTGNRRGGPNAVWVRLGADRFCT